MNNWHSKKRVQRVNDEPGKILNLLFFAYLFGKWAETFNKLQFFTFGQKQCLYFTHSTLQYFEKLTLKKKQKKNLNGYISKTRTNLDSKPIFSESSFNFLQNSIIFCKIYPRGYSTTTPYNPQRRWQRLASLKELRSLETLDKGIKN